MTEQVEIHIPFSDLTKITVECPVCKAETSLDISDPKHRGVALNTQGFFCTVCNKHFDSRLRDAIISAFALYDALKTANLIDKVSFRVKKTVQ